MPQGLLRNLITDVDGLRIGNAHDDIARTGVTVILPDTACAAAMDVRGGAPGTRESDALSPLGLVEKIDALVLSGGSVYGLEAASSVTAWLGAQGRGYAMRNSNVVAPIVPAAILFDLANGGRKDWGERPPYATLGRAAVISAATDFVLGNSGAGRGARAGLIKGGLGSASARSEAGYTIGALAAVNCFGSVLMPGTGCFWAWAFERDNEFGGIAPPPHPIGDLDLPADTKLGAFARAHTTLAVVATDAELTRIELQRVAIMAQDGLARAIRPVHTPFDGDVVFALSTGVRKITASREFAVMNLGALSADCLARAIARGIYEAKSTYDLSAYRDR